MLGGRYRLLAPIGTGASATVYLADDVVLRRRVAVKVLHDALAGDASFLKRFQAEARAAAALNHPHIMAVHDWGQGDVPYLVTELLEGGSLRAMLDERSPLDLAQVRQIGVDTARALDYAHRRGFVHRDIKPANILFDEEGILRIADFGLARALAEAAWTEPAGAVLGTARYASPEQAQGATLDGRSDVYSLGLVLIEAATGSIPFVADTTLGTLMARVDKQVPVPASMGPLSRALAAVGVPDPADRPDANEFATLLMAAGDLGSAAPLPMAGVATLRPDELDPREPTTIYVPEEAVFPPGSDHTIIDGGVPVIAGSAIFDPDATVAVPAVEQPATRTVERSATAAVASTGASEGAATTPNYRRNRIVAAIVVLALLGAGVGGFLLLRTPSHTIGDYVGSDIAEVEAQLSDLGLKVEQTGEYREVEPAGRVLSQDPAPGTSLKEGSTVTLGVSLGPPPVPVPTNLAGKTVDEATAALTAAGLRIGPLTDAFDENVAKGIVLSVAPGVEAEMPKGSPIGLVVSAGPKPRTIPANLVGRPAAEVTTALEALGFKVARDEQFSDTVAEGNVISVDPASGQTAPRGTTVKVVVSKGKGTTIPAINGRSCTDYATALRNLGLTVTINPFGSVVSGVTPASGTQVKAGSAVTVACR